MGQGNKGFGALLGRASGTGDGLRRLPRLERVGHECNDSGLTPDTRHTARRG
jgi:hypothetical protein